MKHILIITFLLSSLLAFNIKITDSNIANAQTTLIELKKEQNIRYKYLVFEKKKYRIFPHPIKKQTMYALLPMSYYAKKNTKKIHIIYSQHDKDKSKYFFIKVKDGKYKKEKINVSKSKVNPKAEKVKERISREYSEAMKTYNRVTSKSYIKSKFILPLESFITSDFGKARVYNGSLKGYHSGTDFRAKIGTPIHASNDGIVVLVKQRFYSGGTVIINHGQGIYTCYFHMSKFHVKKNQKVKKGEVLGLSGMSGRVTGPHLHFAVRINGVQVDPLQFIELINTKLLRN